MERKLNSVNIVDIIVIVINEINIMKPYISRENIKNLVEYCLSEREKDNDKLKDLIDRLDIEFKNARIYYRTIYKLKR